MLSIEQYSEYWDIEKKCNIIEVLHNERMVRDQIELQLPIYFDEMYNYKKDNLEKIKYYLWLCRRKRSYRIVNDCRFKSKKYNRQRSRKF